MKTMAAAKFKAQCLAVLDEVQSRREPVLVTKHGRSVAQIVPVPQEHKDSIFGFYRGKLEIIGDIVAPLYTDAELVEFEANLLGSLSPNV